tara:strand:- start:414 stop:692 length:279 start_codon:yes stop_codon:yes gene_type:complete
MKLQPQKNVFLAKTYIKNKINQCNGATYELNKFIGRLNFISSNSKELSKELKSLYFFVNKRLDFYTKKKEKLKDILEFDLRKEKVNEQFIKQ